MVDSNKNMLEGYGECGLPPKKENCYLADVEDCFRFMSNLKTTLINSQKHSLRTIQEIHYCVFEGVGNKHFKQMNPQHCQSDKLNSLLYILFQAHNICQPIFRAAKSALQFAIMDIFSKSKHMSLAELIFNCHPQTQCHSFYTVSIQSLSEMLINAISALPYTCCIKIKWDKDIPSLIKLLFAIELQTNKQGKQVQKYLIDANASWSLQTMRQFLWQSKQKENQVIFQKILYIQQPFPVILSEEQCTKWSLVKEQSSVKIMADESFSLANDISKVAPICHGINIKMEKTGGPISTLKAIQAAQASNMQIMLGSMVSTQLACAQAYHFHSVTNWLDIDGSLLIDKPSVQGGFKWGGPGPLQDDYRSYGIGVNCDALDSVQQLQ